jgi:translocation and assembly module TamB
VVDDAYLKMTLSSDSFSNGSADLNPWPLLRDKTIAISDLSTDIVMDGSLVTASRDVSVELSVEEDLVRYRFDGYLSAEDEKHLAQIGRIDSQLAINGSLSSADSSVNGRIDFITISSDLLDVSPISVDYTLNENVLTMRRIDDRRPLDLAFTSDSGGWKLTGVAENLAIRELATPGPDRPSLDPWFSMTIDGRFAMAGGPGSTEPSFDVDLDVTVPEGPTPWAWNGRLDFDGYPSRLRIDQIALDSPHGSVSYQGDIDVTSWSPDGRFAFSMNEDLLGYPVNAAFDLNTNLGVVSGEPVLFEAADLIFHDFQFLVIQEEESVAISLLAVPGLPDETADRRLNLDALFDYSDEAVVHGFVGVHGFEAGHIARLSGLTEISSLPFIRESLLDMNGLFEANAETWGVSISEGMLVQDTNPDNQVAFRGRATPGQWSLDGIRMSWNDYVIDGRGFAEYGEGAGKAEGRFLIQDKLFPINAQWDENGRFSVQGEGGLLAEFGARSASGRSISVSADQIEIPLKNGSLTASLDLQGLAARDDFDLYVRRASFNVGGRNSIPDQTLDFTGTINPRNVELPSITIVDEFGTLSGNAVFESTRNWNNLNGRLYLKGRDEELYEIAVTRQNVDWNIGLDVRSAMMNRFGRERLTGSMDMTGRMNGTIEAPVMTLQMRTDDASFDGRPFTANAKAAMENGKLRVQDINLNHEGLIIERGLVLLDMNKGTLRSTADMNAIFNQVAVESGFSMALDFERGFNLTSMAEVPDMSYSGTLATRALYWDRKEHLPPLTFQFTKDDELFRIRNPDIDVLNIVYRFSSGELNVVSGDPMPVIAAGRGVVRDGNIDLSFPVLDIDPVLINYVMLRDPILQEYHVVFQDGRFVGSLDINGAADDPDLNGTIRAVNLKVDTPYTYAEIQPASSTIQFEGKRVTFDQIDVPVGDGIVYGRGYFELDRLQISDFDMVYGGRSTGKSPGVPVYYPLLGVDLDGVFTGEVHMTGDGQRYYLDADLTFPILNASLGTAIEPVPQRNEEKFQTPVFLDFNFITGNNCTFFLPNEQLKIVQATAEPGQVINMTLSTNPKSLSLTGSLPIRSGNIFYFDRDFQVTDGAMRFNETLGNFNPILSFRAETRVRDELGEEVTVALVYNAPIQSDFNPRIETAPSRSELEILALFGQAVVPYSESGSSEANTVLLATGGVFGQVGIVQPFEDVIREGLNLDMVTIRTDIIENTLAEGLTRSDGPDSNATSSGLGRYLDNTSLFAGKYIGNALFVSGSISANYFESQRLRSIFGGLEFETSVSMEMETPFFNVAWSYSPEPGATDRNFVADNKITLKWQFSY